MAKKQAVANHGPPKAGRVKCQAAADDNAAGPSNEAPAAKRPRGRPPKGVSVDRLAPMPIAISVARKLRKAADATQPASPSSSRAVATKAPRSSSPSITNDTASEAPKRRSARRRVSRGRSRHSSRSRHSGRARKAPSRESSPTRSERSRTKNEEEQQEPPPRPVQKLFLGHLRALEARQEASPCP
ncbi:histone H1, gonadal-like [Rhipicephalus sanguineus]|uniref:histone H1, gonadal-like n=1 Tax=Rhipicephalus sanguineus TaxID=34632 RepID=UPI001895859D|nr:histone H1, gonadal-like [Rhipicephalus sanguineus]